MHRLQDENRVRNRNVLFAAKSLFTSRAFVLLVAVLANMSPSSSSGVTGGSVSMTVNETRANCTTTFGPYNRTSDCTWTTTNSNVATVSGGSVSYVAAGSCSINGQFAALVYLPGCSTMTVNPNPGSGITVRPTVTSVDIVRGVVGTTYRVDIRGTGFTSSATVSLDPSTGVAVSGVVYAGNTEILADFAIANNASGGNRQIIVTVGSQSSIENVYFYVQIPTLLGGMSVGSLTDEPGGCGATKSVSYTLQDQANQTIMEDLTVQEVFSNFSSTPSGLTPPTPQSPVANAGQLIDVVGYSIPTCPTAFSASLTQKFKVTIGSTVYNLSTTNSISYGRDASGNKFVTITNTTP